MNSKHISMELTGDGARVTNVKLDGGKLILTIEAQLADSQLTASGVDGSVAELEPAFPPPADVGHAPSSPTGRQAPAPDTGIFTLKPAPSSPVPPPADPFGPGPAEAIPPLFAETPLEKPRPVRPVEQPKSISFGGAVAEPVEELNPFGAPAMFAAPPAAAPALENQSPFAPQAGMGMPPLAMSEESNVFGGARHGEPQPAISFGQDLLPGQPAAAQPPHGFGAPAPQMAGLSLDLGAPAPAPAAQPQPPAAAPLSMGGFDLPPAPGLGFEAPAAQAPAPAPMAAPGIGFETPAASPVPGLGFDVPAAGPAPGLSMQPPTAAPVPGLDLMNFGAPQQPAMAAPAAATATAPGLGFGAPAAAPGIGFDAPATAPGIAFDTPAALTPAPAPAPTPAPATAVGGGFGFSMMQEEAAPAPAPAPAPVPAPALTPEPEPAPPPAPAPAPEEKPRPEGGGTTVLIRYTCPKCKTQGMQAVDKVGTVVNCSNCGKAMRLVMKK